jgi:hypothetical protein
MHPDVGARAQLIESWIERRLGPEARDWADAQVRRIASGAKGALAAAVGLASRKVGKAPLKCDEDELSAADRLAPGFNPGGWSIDEAVRVLFVLSSYSGDDAAFARTLDQFIATAEIGEKVALLKGLPLYPAGERLLPIASEAIRSAIQPVYEAVAHSNTYPARHFTEAMWNQMVVKALFIGSRLDPIHGLDERRNADLARILIDYAHERRAARREITPELWRCIGPFAAGAYFADLLQPFSRGGQRERQAAALALAECPDLEALKALETAPTIWRDIKDGRLTWSDIA